MTAVTESNGTAEWMPRYERLLARQIELCRALLELAEQQRVHIDNEEPEVLLTLLSDRQGLIDQLREIADEAAPLRARWSTGAHDDGSAAAGRVRDRITELTALMRSISERDAEDRRRLSRSRDVLAGRLAGVARSRGALSAYGRSPERGPRYQDREG